MSIALVVVALAVVIVIVVGLMRYSDKREVDRWKDLNRVD